MSDSALSSEDTAQASQPTASKRTSPKYRPDKDGPRMKLYMANKRAKDKAGFGHMTVRNWLKTLEAK